MDLSIINKWCFENNVSISELEKKCNFGNATIRSWKESSPRLSNLEKVSKVTGIPISVLIGEQENDITPHVQ